MIRRTRQKIKFIYEHFLFNKIREQAPPISKAGVEVKAIRSKGFSGGVSAKDFPTGKRPEIFTLSTVIINSGYGVWEFEVPKFVRKRLVDMTLRIETIRTHGMLHTPPYDLELKGQPFRKRARIFLNDQLVDNIVLVRPLPHGGDFGINSRRPFPILFYIDKDKNFQTVRIETDEDVLWDIDRVTLEPIILRKVIKTEAAMIIGAIISAIMGILASILIL